MTTSIPEQTRFIFEPVKLELDYKFNLPEYTKEIFVPVAGDAGIGGLSLGKTQALITRFIEQISCAWTGAE